MVKTVNGKEKRTFQVIEVHNKNTKLDKKATDIAMKKDLTGSHASAARKAGNALCRYKKIKGACVWFVTVREKTQGSDGKVRQYKVIRFKRDEPLVLEGRPAIEYDTKVFAVKGPLRMATAKKTMKATPSMRKTAAKKTMKPASVTASMKK